MSILQVIREALESLMGNKMRSALTVLGIVIGVASVIAMMAVGEGVQQSITGEISDIGTNLIFVLSGNDTAEIRNPKALTLDDAEAIADPLSAPSVALVAPVLQSSMEVSTAQDSMRVTITGVTTSYQEVANEVIVEGEWFSEDQVVAKSAVAVIGPDTAENLLGRTVGVVGESVRIDGTPFRIIGVLEAKGASGFSNQDDRILVPLTTAQVRLMQRSNHDSVDMIQAQAIDSDSVNRATEEISEILRTRHRTEVGLDDFTIFTQDSILDVATSVTNVITIFLGGVAAISLLVGGIGIMNIMLVSVTERTKEIGLRKAIGAKKRDILIQFLTESVLLSLFGGFVGIVLAWVLATILGMIFAASGTPIEPNITMSAILMATMVSSAVGLIFGIFPANNAANLQPVEALRHE
jgi:putative ABC transport system permease protein